VLDGETVVDEVTEAVDVPDGKVDDAEIVAQQVGLEASMLCLVSDDIYIMSHIIHAFMMSCHVIFMMCSLIHPPHVGDAVSHKFGEAEEWGEVGFIEQQHICGGVCARWQRGRRGRDESVG